MRDNHSEHSFDKGFVNASWKDLKQTLDVDMPVVKSYNNRVITILSLLLLLSVASIAVLVIQQNREIPITELIKEKIIYKEVIIEKSLDNSSVNNNSNIKTPFSKTLVSNFNSSNLEYTPSSNSDEESKFETIALFTQKPKAVNSNIEKLDQLKSKKITSISTKDAFTPDANINETFSINNVEAMPKVRYSLGLLSFISNNLDYSGYGFSSGIQIPISKKFGIQTGFSINFVSRDFLFFPFISKGNSSQTAGTADLNKERTYYDGLESFNQIFLPLNFNYNVNEVFSLSSGFKFRYTYSETINTLLKTRASQTLTKSKSVENTFFNHSNIGLTAGFTYKVNDRLNFIFDSEWGVRSLINKNEFSNPSARSYDLNLINLTTNITF